jgi:uncharacterized protein
VVELNLDRLELGRSSLPLDADLARDERDADLPPLEVHVRGELTVDAMEQRVVVRGAFEAAQSAVCDRCAREFELRTRPEIEMMILRNPSRGEDPQEEEEDAWVVHQSRGVVELDEPLLEAVVLSLPQKTLCREDCRGLCPRCGQDLNEGSCQCPTESPDPRWAALEKLRDEADREPEGS